MYKIRRKLGKDSSSQSTSELFLSMRVEQKWAATSLDQNKKVVP